MGLRKTASYDILFVTEKSFEFSLFRGFCFAIFHSYRVRASFYSNKLRIAFAQVSPYEWAVHQKWTRGAQMQHMRVSGIGRTVARLKRDTFDVGGATVLLLLLLACSWFHCTAGLHGFRELNTRKWKRICSVSIQLLHCMVSNFLRANPSPCVLCVFSLPRSALFSEEAVFRQSESSRRSIHMCVPLKKTKVMFCASFLIKSSWV